MAIRIYRSRATTPTARNLSNRLSEYTEANVKLLKINNSSWTGKEKDLVINWGSSKPYTTNAVLLNKPEAVKNSIYKLRTFDLLEEQGLYIPSVVTTEDKDALVSFLVKETHLEGTKVFLLRSTETGHSGEGIHVLDNLEDLFNEWKTSTDQNHLIMHNPVDLTAFYKYLVDHYTPFADTKFVSAYFKGRDEYRIHVMLGKVIFMQRKGLRTDDDRPEEPNFIVRNHDNGFIFQHNDITVPELVQEAAIRAIEALGMDFGAVDIKYNPNNNHYCILEINSAPGLTGTTLEVYTEAFNSIYKVIQE